MSIMVKQLPQYSHHHLLHAEVKSENSSSRKPTVRQENESLVDAILHDHN